MSDRTSEKEAALPIIDFADPGSDVSSEKWQEIAREISTATTNDGFFYIRGHGISEQTIETLRTSAREFFAQSTADKKSIAINQYNRGYLGPGEARMHGATRTDQKEVFFWGPDLTDDDPDLLAGIPLCGPNRWPDAPTGFRDHVIKYANGVQRIGEKVLKAFALSLGLPADFFTAFYERPMLRGQLIHYPPQTDDTPDDQFGVASHTDFGCITLLLQETPGLEVLSRKGDWIPAPPIEGTLIINIGDLLERWTNRRLPSNSHRVRNTTGTGRYSIAMFFDPSPRAIVDPRDMADIEKSDFEPISASDYIIERNQGAFAHYNPGIMVKES